MISANNRFNKLFLSVATAFVALVGHPDTASAQNALAFTPPSLAFTFQTGGTAPAAQPLTVTSSGAPLPVNTLVATTSGGPWLTITPASGTTPATFNVGVNPAGLPAATYNGTISLSSPSTGAAPLLVPVMLTVTSAPALSLSQTSLQFFFQAATGTALPAQAAVSVASSSTPLTYTVTNATVMGGPWLVVAPSSGVTPSTITIGANPTGLPAGVYMGTVTITAPGASNNPQTVNVTFTISASPLLIPSSSAFNFSFQQGGAAPATQTLALNSTSTPISYAMSFVPGTGGAFLTIAPTTANTPSSVTLTANPATLAPGTYNGQINIVGAGAANSPLVIPVSLTVGNNPLLTFSQPSANFNFQIGTGPPAPQIINIGSTGAPLTFTALASTSTGGNFLTVTQSAGGTTPGTLTLTVNPAGLTTGTYNGTVTVTPAGSTPQTIPVTLTVSNSALVNINPPALTFTASAAGGAAPGLQTVALTSTSDPIAFTAAFSTSAGGNWLVVSPTTGNVPINLNVGANPAGLAVGTYTGSVVITAGGQTQTIPVTLVVNSGIVLSVSPPALTFTQPTLAAPPVNQTIAVSSTNGSVPIAATATTTTGGSWLTVTSTAATPGTVTVSANGTHLDPGTYMGTVTITGTGATGSPQVVPVTFIVTAVTPAPTLSATPASVSVNTVAGGANPANATLALAASGGATVPFTVGTATATGGNWLTATPVSGTTPSSIQAGINIAGLAAGTYTGTITITPSAAAPAGTAALTIPVALTLTTPVPPTPVILGITNAASYVLGAVSPGEIISIFGTNVGPAVAVGLRLTAAGSVDTNIGNTRVLFDGIAAPLTYVSAAQVNTIVPYEVAGRGSTTIQVEVAGVRSAGTVVRLADSAPGIFTQDTSGSGPGAILNQNFSVNTAANPATKGSVIQIFATGEGLDNPPGVTGSISTSALKTSVIPVTATVGGQPAQVTYAGSAPGLVAGVLQVNVVVPNNAPTGPAAVVITIGTPSSQANVTVAVQ